MIATKGGSRAIVAFIPVLVANLLPLGAIVFFNWRVPEAMFVYWVEITVSMILYSGLALFATREPNVAIRTITPPTISVPLVSGRSGSVQLTQWLPPITYQNVQYATGGLVFGLAAWLISGTVLVDLLNPEPVLQGGRYDRPIHDAVSVIEAASSREALAVAVLLSGGQLVVVSQFVRQRQYEHFSAPTLAEIPCRVGVYWGIVALFTSVLILLTWPFVGEFDPTTFTEYRVLVSFIAAKLAVDWALTQVRQRAKPGRFTRWLTPHDPNGSD